MTCIRTTPPPGAAVRALQDALEPLATMPPALVRFHQQFFRQERHCRTETKNGTAHWRFGTSQHCGSEWVELECREQRLLVRVEHSETPIVGVRPFWDYQGDSRLLSWMLEHDTLLCHLNELFNADWQPSAIYQWQRTQSNPVLLDWRLEHAHHVQSGSLALPIASAERWMHSTQWQSVQRPPNEIAIPARLVMSLANMPSADLAAFEAGDVLVAGNLTSCWQSLQITFPGKALDAMVLPCALSSTGDINHRPWEVHQPSLTILSTSRETPMSTELDTADPPNGTDSSSVHSAPNTTPLTRLPMTVQLELAELQLPAHTLMHMQPGYLIELEQPLAHQCVTVKVQQRPWARGELVVIGDRLGIRLLDIADHGSEQS